MRKQEVYLPPRANPFLRKDDLIKMYRRTVEMRTSTATSYTPGTTIQIPIDTSMPGVCVDTGTAALKFEANIINTNFCADFISFPKCGANTFFESMVIRQGGTSLEEIDDFPSVIQNLYNMAGIAAEPMNMYRPCRYKQPVGPQFHVNAIKPPMVSTFSGNPIYYDAVYVTNENFSSVWATGSSTYNYNGMPFLIGTAAAGVSYHKIVGMSGASGYTAFATGNTTQASGITAACVNPNFPGISLDSSAGTDGSVQPGRRGRNDTANENLETFTTAADTQQVNFIKSTYRGARQPDISATRFFYGGASVDGSGFGISWGAGSGVQANETAAAFLPTATANTTNCMSTGYLGINKTIDRMDGKLTTLWGTPPISTLFGNQASMYDNPDYNPHNPLNWPDVMVNDMSIPGPETVIPANLQDYLMSLTNVKYIPIKLKGSERASAADQATFTGGTAVSSSLNFANVAVKSTTSGQTFTLLCIVPFNSGILGGWNDYLFMSFLCGVNSLTIELKLRAAPVALQVSMCPTEIVRGTIRDYLPWGGSAGGVYGQYNLVNPVGEAEASANNWQSSKTLTAMMASRLTNQAYFGIGTSGTYSATANPSYLAQTDIASNSYFGMPSGCLYQPQATSVTASQPTLFVTARPTIGGYSSVIGANLCSLQRYLTAGGTTGITGNGVGVTFNRNMVFTPYSIAAMEGKASIMTTMDEEHQMQGVYSHFFAKTNDNASPMSVAIATTTGTGAVDPTYIPTTGSTTAGGYRHHVSTSGMAEGLCQHNYGAMNMYMNAGNTSAPEQAMGTSLVNTATISACGLPMPNVGQIQQSATTTIGNGVDDTWALDYVGYMPGFSYLLNTIGNNGTATQPQSIDTRGVSYAIAKSGSGRPITQSATTQFGPMMYRWNQNDASIENNTPVWTPIKMSVTKFMIHPSGVPTNQYMLVKTPWIKKAMYYQLNVNSEVTTQNQGIINVYGANVDYADLASESEVLYGTYLEAGRPQSFRVFNQYNGSTNNVTYTISNMCYLVDQISLPPTIVADMLAAAARGPLAITTKSIRTSPVPLASSDTQTSILSIKSSSTNQLIFYYKPSEFTGSAAQLYDSNTTMCPFTRIASADPYKLTSAVAFQGPLNKASYNANPNQQCACGQQTPFTKKNLSVKDGTFSIQLTIGTEKFPVKAISSAAELIEYYTNVHMTLFDTTRKINCKFQYTLNEGFTSSATSTYGNVSSFAGSALPTNYYLDCFVKDGFFTAFTAAQYLDNQVAVGNPNWNKMYAAFYNRTITTSGTYSAEAAAAGTKGIGMTSSLTATAALGVDALFEARGKYVLPAFEPLECTFLIPINIAAWSSAEANRVGRYLGSSQTELTVTGANALVLNGSDSSGVSGVQMTCMYTHELVIVHTTGGTATSYI